MGQARTMAVMGSVHVAKPAGRSTWRAVSVPTEHGGWGLTVEPAVLGLLIAPSGAGIALAFAAIVAFLLRTPVKIVLVDQFRGRSLHRTRVATGIAAAELAVLVGLWLIRIRVGLIYEVAKMNVLLGESSARVTRVNPLSISTLVQTLINLAGGGHAAVLALHLLPPFDSDRARLLVAVGIGAAVTLTLQAIYVIWIAATSRSLNLQSPPQIHG